MQMGHLKPKGLNFAFFAVKKMTVLGPDLQYCIVCVVM